MVGGCCTTVVLLYCCTRVHVYSMIVLQYMALCCLWCTYSVVVAKVYWIELNWKVEPWRSLFFLWPNADLPPCAAVLLAHIGSHWVVQVMHQETVVWHCNSSMLCMRWCLRIIYIQCHNVMCLHALCVSRVSIQQKHAKCHLFTPLTVPWCYYFYIGIHGYGCMHPCGSMCVLVCTQVRDATRC